MDLDLTRVSILCLCFRNADTDNDIGKSRAQGRGSNAQNTILPHGKEIRRNCETKTDPSLSDQRHCKGEIPL